MPFTPFHLGPALAIGLPLRRYIHVPTFVVANVIVDLEPLLVLVLNLQYPLHGYLHTFVGALALGLALGYAMYVSERWLGSLWRKMVLVPETLGLRAFIMAGISGTLLHVLLDSPLYHDIKPLYPISLNPLYSPSLTPLIYRACVFTAIAGLTYYFYLLANTSLRFGFALLGALYLSISLYGFTLYVHGLRDVPLVSVALASMVIGLVCIAIAALLPRKPRTSATLAIACCLIAASWLGYVAWRAAIAHALTPLLASLVLALGVMHLVCTAKAIRRSLPSYPHSS